MPRYAGPAYVLGRGPETFARDRAGCCTGEDTCSTCALLACVLVYHRQIQLKLDEVANVR